MIVYPYRQPNGSRLILNAVSLDDARKWLSDCSGPGVAFCKVDMEFAAIRETMTAPDRDDRIDALLAVNHNYVTHG